MQLDDITVCECVTGCESCCYEGIFVVPRLRFVGFRLGVIGSIWMAIGAFLLWAGITLWMVDAKVVSLILMAYGGAQAALGAFLALDDGWHSWVKANVDEFRLEWTVRIGIWIRERRGRTP